MEAILAQVPEELLTRLEQLLAELQLPDVIPLLDRGLALADRVDSTQTAEEQERVFQRMWEGTVRLVYVAPERVRDPRLMAALKVGSGWRKVVWLRVPTFTDVHGTICSRENEKNGRELHLSQRSE